MVCSRGVYSRDQERRSVGAAIHEESSAERDARMAWWRDARFGMFIHWGLYAVPAGEWKGKPYRRSASGS